MPYSARLLFADVTPPTAVDIVPRNETTPSAPTVPALTNAFEVAQAVAPPTAVASMLWTTFCRVRLASAVLAVTQPAAIANPIAVTGLVISLSGGLRGRV